MRKLFLSLIIVGFTSSAWGQGNVLKKVVSNTLNMEAKVARQVMRSSSKANQIAKQAVISSTTSALPRNSVLDELHTGTPLSRPTTTPKETPPIWALRSSATPVTSMVRKRSRNELIMDLSERGILPQGWQDYTREGLQELLDTYLSLKSAGSTPSRFKVMQEDGTIAAATDTELKNWAEQQPDYIPENYVFTPYTEPFNTQIKSLRILMVNDGKEALEPLQEMAEKNSRVEIVWESDPVQALQLLKQNPHAYDVVLTDYCMRNGTACTLGMGTYADKVSTPIILYSRAGATAPWMFQYNIMGRIDIAVTRLDAARVLNYLSNIVATGKAYPSK